LNCDVAGVVNGTTGEVVDAITEAGILNCDGAGVVDGAAGLVDDAIAAARI